MNASEPESDRPFVVLGGSHRLTVRATDGNEQLQIAVPSPVAPAGATGLHTVTVDVT